MEARNQLAEPPAELTLALVLEQWAVAARLESASGPQQAVLAVPRGQSEPLALMRTKSGRHHTGAAYLQMRDPAATRRHRTSAAGSPPACQRATQCPKQAAAASGQPPVSRHSCFPGPRPKQHAGPQMEPPSPQAGLLAGQRRQQACCSRRAATAAPKARPPAWMCPVGSLSAGRSACQLCTAREYQAVRRAAHGQVGTRTLYGEGDHGGAVGMRLADSCGCRRGGSSEKSRAGRGKRPGGSAVYASALSVVQRVRRRLLRREFRCLT